MFVVSQPISAKKRMSQLDLLITALCFCACCEKYSITRNLRRYHYEEPLR